MKKIVMFFTLFAFILTISACEDTEKTNQAEQLVKLMEIGFSDNDNASHVTKNLTLNTYLGGFTNVTIKWLSLNQDVISHEGEVTRPELNTNVILIVRLKIGELTAQKNVELTVIGTRINASITTLVLDQTYVIDITKETQVNTLETPKLTGYKFLYWETLEGLILNGNDFISSNITIRAVLEEAVTFSYVIEIYTQVINTNTYTLFEMKTLSEPKDTLIRYDQEIRGYSRNQTLSDPYKTLLDNNQVFKLYYDIKTVTVTYYYKGNVIETKVFAFEAVLTFPEKESDVIGWSFEPQGNTINNDVILENNVNIYAITEEEEEEEITYEGYYSVLDGVSNSNLLSTLRTLLSNYTYRNYDYARDLLQDSDEDPNNSNNIILVYNRASVLSRWDAGATWNREHVWPQSLLANTIQKADVHNLKPANPNINSTRGNNQFAAGSGSYGIVDGGFFPGEKDKGDIARIIMFMHVKYNLNINAVGKINILLRWHEQDPVDPFESNRNDVIYSDTKNRNPFIDYPDLAYRLFGFPSYVQAYESFIYDMYYQFSKDLYIEKQKTPF
jgi:endonuclease I